MHSPVKGESFTPLYLWEHEGLKGEVSETHEECFTEEDRDGSDDRGGMKLEMSGAGL